MTRFQPRTAVLCFLLGALVSSLSCNRTGPAVKPDSETELWEMRITGETVATYELLLKKRRIEKDVFVVHGEFSGISEDHLGGTGMVRCTFHGRIHGNELEAHFSGRGDMAISLSITGNLWGTLSGSTGSGQWRASHEEGLSQGQWTLKRIHPAP